VATLALSCIPAGAQTVGGVVSGIVLDQSNSPIKGASVRLKDSGTQRERAVTAGSAGQFTIPSVAPGEYRLTVSQLGFGDYAINLTVRVDRDIDLEVKLKVKGGESVDVTAPAEPLKTDSAAVSGTILREQLQTLPLDGRNFYELSLLLPGVVPPAQGSAGTDRGDFAINVNGAREDANLFLLDGVYNSDPKLNGLGVQPSLDAVREYEVLTSTYDASFGRNAGGQINVVTRSGTNSLHGSLYEYFRNGAFDARNYFAPQNEAAPKYQRNQFGATLGGTIVKNRTFFFADYEGTRANQGITTVTNVPTALERIGDFSQSSVYAINLQTGQPFPGNKIPTAYINPVGAAIAALYPLPNRSTPGANYVSSPTQTDEINQFDIRIDHALAARTELTGRISFSNRDLMQPFSGASDTAVPGYGTDVPRHATNAMIGLTHSFTPTIINELRLGFNRVAQRVLQQNPVDVNAQVGLPTPWTNPRDNGLSSISINGYSPLGDEINNPQLGNINTYQINDQLSMVRGRHLLKVGFDIRKLEQNAYRDVNSRGLIDFVGFTGNALAEELMGIVSVSADAAANNPEYLRTQSYDFFAADTWRVTPSLTLNYGLRYEYNTPGVDKYNHANVYDVASQSVVAVGQNGFPRGAYDPDKTNFAPRFGFAYKLGSKTVVRSGYGIYFDQGALAPAEGLYFSAPYYVSNEYIPFAQFPIYINNPFPSDYPFPIPSSATAIQRNLKTGYLQDWNFTIQHAISGRTVAEIGYVASKGTKLLTARDVNQPQPSNAPSYVRPNPAYADITYLESAGNSSYQSLQFRLQQRLAAGFSGLFSYTYGKSLDDSSGTFASTGDPNYPQNSYDLHAERGLSNFDVRHRAVLSYSYAIPLFTHSKLLGGWQTMGIWQFQTGRPLTVSLLPDDDNANTGISVLGFGANARPNVLSNPNNGPHSVNEWFNTSAFVIPPFGNFGNSGRNTVEGPGLATINLSLVKDTHLTERVNLQFKAEFFNALDRANFGLPDNFIGSPTFGRILSAGDPRRIQLALRLLF
jgi:hypothetical protein